jgi:hypothetical protein
MVYQITHHPNRLSKGYSDKYGLNMSFIWPVSAWLVLSSIVVHGMTVPLFNLTLEADPNGIRRPSEISHIAVDDASNEKAALALPTIESTPVPVPTVIINDMPESEITPAALEALTIVEEPLPSSPAPAYIA